MPPDRLKRQGCTRMTEESDLSLEIVILLILGVFMLLFGILLFRIHTGDLPYNPDSTYGLFLVIVSFQVITMGKTPFGDLRRSWALVIVGMCTAVLGMASSFIPGQFTGFVRMLVGIVLFAGGIALFIQLFAAEKKARMWMKISGILQQLTVACGLVYVFTVVSGLMTLLPGITTNPQTAVVLIMYGISFFYLCWCIWKVSRTYPPEEAKDSASAAADSDNAAPKVRFRFLRDASLPLSPAILLLLGILFTFLGLLLFPVALGLIVFSPDGQLGLLLTIMAIQLMALGDTPMGRYKRSWLMVITGSIFAALGVISSIVPGLLTGVIQILLGVLNIVGGAALLIRHFLPVLREIRSPRAAPVIVPPILKKLNATQTVLNLMTVAFGISMLMPGLVSILIIAGILVINGILLLILASLLQKLAAMQPG
ncbi:MAG: hypothetical protein AB9866_08310 [Syntrophobacteraceae bacterium]